MERTLSVIYPVLRQNKGVLLNMFEKEYNDCGFLQTYFIIHPYFARVVHTKCPLHQSCILLVKNIQSQIV